jgi:hypothetical protein
MVEIMPVILEMPIVAAQSRDRLLAPFGACSERMARPERDLPAEGT